MMRAVVPTLLALVLLVPPAMAQDEEAPPQPVRIVLVDGSEIVGVVLSEDDTTIRFRTLSGVEMTIPKADVRARRRLDGTLRDGRYLRYDVNRTRLFFAPTGRVLARGEGYVAVYELFIPFVAIGLDPLMLAGGVSLIPGVPLTDQLLYVAPKVSLWQRGEVDLAAGVIAAFIDGNTGGLLFGSGTLGAPDRALTLGVGFAFGNGDIESTPVLLLGGELQLSGRVKLISENYVLPALDDNVAVISGGLRLLGDRISADFGLFTSPNAFGVDGLPFFPWLSFSYHFETR